MEFPIDNPCDESWEGMEPRGEGRYCARCDRVVVDLSRLTAAQASARVRAATGRLCLALRMDASTHEPIFRLEPAVAPRWAGGLVLAAALVSSSCASSSEASERAEILGEVEPPVDGGPPMLPIGPDAVAEVELTTRAVPMSELDLPEDSTEPTPEQRRLTARKRRPRTCALPASASPTPPSGQTYMLLGF